MAKKKNKKQKTQNKNKKQTFFDQEKIWQPTKRNLELKILKLHESHN